MNWEKLRKIILPRFCFKRWNWLVISEWSCTEVWCYEYSWYGHYGGYDVGYSWGQREGFVPAVYFSSALLRRLNICTKTWKVKLMIYEDKLGNISHCALEVSSLLSRAVNNLCGSFRWQTKWVHIRLKIGGKKLGQEEITANLCVSCY